MLKLSNYNRFVVVLLFCLFSIVSRRCNIFISYVYVLVHCEFVNWLTVSQTDKNADLQFKYSCCCFCCCFSFPHQRVARSMNMSHFEHLTKQTAGFLAKRLFWAELRISDQATTKMSTNLLYPVNKKRTRVTVAITVFFAGPTKII